MWMYTSTRIGGLNNKAAIIRIHQPLLWLWYPVQRLQNPDRGSLCIWKSFATGQYCPVKGSQGGLGTGIYAPIEALDEELNKG